MSTLTNLWGPRIGIGPGGTITFCGEPLRPPQREADAFVSADDVERHADHAVASPWTGAMSAPSAAGLAQMVALNPQPLPPREVGIGALKHADDFCGTRVPMRLPPPVPPTPRDGAPRMHALFEIGTR